MGTEPNYGAILTPNNRSIFSLCASYLYGLSFINILEKIFTDESNQVKMQFIKKNINK